MSDPIDTVSRPYRYKQKKKQIQTAEAEAKQTNKKNLKQTRVFAKTDEPAIAARAPSSGLGMKGSRLLTRQRAWQLRFPEKRRAHEAVKGALRRGTLVKGACEDCGTDQHVDAHHERYDRPLEVTWLCRKHHTARHRRQILKKTAEVITRAVRE